MFFVALFVIFLAARLNSWPAAVSQFVTSRSWGQQAAIAILGKRTIGKGGVIVLDRWGRVGIAHNTPYIAHAIVTADGEILTGIKRC